MLEKTTELMFITMSSNVKKRIKQYRLKRAAVLPNNESLVSNIVNNRRPAKYPNLMSNGVAFEIANRLHFRDVNQMLWGNVSWEAVYKTAIDEIYSYNGNEESMLNLHNLLINALTYNVNFAYMRAIVEFGFGIDKNNQSAEFDNVKVNALTELKQRYILLHKQEDSSGIPSIDLKKQFYEEFNDTKLIKFSVRFPQFLYHVFENSLKSLQPIENSIGILSYHLTESSLEIFNQESLSWYSNDKQMQQQYHQINNELNNAIKSLQNIQLYEQNLYKFSTK